MTVGYGQYCPVAKAAEILGERWTMLIVRDLMEGAHRFNDLHRGLPGLSRSVLTERLRDLEREGLLERRPSGGHDEYWLTGRGEDLQPALMALGEWAVRSYSAEPRGDERDPRVLMLWVKRHVHSEALLPGRYAVRFDFHGSHPARAWLLFEDGEASVCDDDPGIDPELTVTTDLRTLHRIFAGRLALKAALRDKSLELEGSPAQIRAFHRWFGYSPFADTTRAHLSRSA